MSGGRSGSPDKERKSPRESGEDSEDESEILEESPCGRWLKRREEVEQRDVPGIECAHLAMDMEEGVEVVWNEVQFSERKNFKAQEDKIQAVFDHLTRLDHPNIVKFHKYWTDTHSDKPRVIFITEYMSCGSLKQFLKRTKRNVKRLPLQAWKRWCTQILSALTYLHERTPPIVHANLTCDTIFIQHNGLVKIGCVAPDAIHQHVRTCTRALAERTRNAHCLAPELLGANVAPSPAADVYAFGMCALETAALELHGNGDAQPLTLDHVCNTIESLDDPSQKDFIYRCIAEDSSSRPTARSLLFHPLLFEVHPLRLLAAHALEGGGAGVPEGLAEEPADEPAAPLAWVPRAHHPVLLTQHPHTEKLDKFLEDVRNGIYPLTAYGRWGGRGGGGAEQRARHLQEEGAARGAGAAAEGEVREGAGETRRVVHMMCNVKEGGGGGGGSGAGETVMTVLLRMDDKMNRQLSTAVTRRDSAHALAQDLVRHAFIHERDRDKIARLLEDALSRTWPPLPQPAAAAS